MKIYVVCDGDYGVIAFKTRAEAEEYILHEAYLRAYYLYYYEDLKYEWEQIKYRYKYYNYCFTNFGAYAMHRETLNMSIEEIELED